MGGDKNLFWRYYNQGLTVKLLVRGSHHIGWGVGGRKKERKNWKINISHGSSRMGRVYGYEAGDGESVIQTVLQRRICSAQGHASLSNREIKKQ